MSKPFEGGTDQSYDDIDRKIWRNYKIALGLGAAVLALGTAMLTTYRLSTSDAQPAIAHIQPGSAVSAEQLDQLYEEIP